MRLLYFRLKGYIQIFNGMGLDEIEIPFHQFQNRIILIRGDNGLGKSTLLNSMTFEPDGSFYYREGHVAEKEIHVIHNGNVYAGTIISGINGNGNRTPTRAYFSKNGEELNPTGNVSSYKEIFTNEFNVDPIFIQLSFASSENRGLVDKSPSERKKYVASIIPSLQFYNEAYKNLSKKSSIFKSHINGLSNKIYSIGDETNLRSTLASLEIQQQNIHKSIEIVRSKMSQEEAKKQILDPDSKIQDLYERIYDELDQVNNALKQFNVSLDREYRKLQINPQNTETVKSELKETTETIDHLSRVIIEEESNLRNQISEQESIIRNIETKQSKLNSIQSDVNYEQLRSTVLELRTKMEQYELEYSGIDQLDMSKDEMIYIVTTINTIYELIHNARQDHETHQYEQVVQSIQDGINLEEQYDQYQRLIRNNELRTIQIAQEQSELKQKIDLASLLNNRPVGCTIDDCYFIRNAVGLNVSSLTEEMERLNQEITSIENKTKEYERKMEQLKGMIQTSHTIFKILETIQSNYSLLRKIQNSKHLLDTNEFLDCMKRGYSFNELLSADQYIKCADIITDYRESKNLLVSLEADLKVHESQIMMVEDLEKEIQTLSVSLEQLSQTITVSRKEIQFDQSLVQKFTEKQSGYQMILSMEQEKDGLLDKKASIRREFESIKDNIKQIASSLELINQYKMELHQLETELTPIDNKISEIRYSLVTLASYNQDLAMYKDKYEKVEFIKKCSSPSKGIQTLFMNIYMSKTIQLSNDLLHNFFNGELSILKPIINEDEFRIPFVGESGLPVDDISFGSTAQKSMMSMILSSVLLVQGSDQYNIIRLDEVDSGLDTKNRMQFPQTIYRLMDILGIEQSIMTSHSIESETYNVNIIHLTKYGIQYE